MWPDVNSTSVCYRFRMPDLVSNKKAFFDYEILERMDAGAELFGYEVKAVRKNMAKLDGARIIVRGNEAYLVGASIRPFQPKNTPKEYDPDRPRRLLLTRKEIDEVLGAESHKGLTIVPLKWHNKGRLLKLEIAIARGKKKADKRETLKARDTKREIDRTLKRQKL